MFCLEKSPVQPLIVYLSPSWLSHCLSPSSHCATLLSCAIDRHRPRPCPIHCLLPSRCAPPLRCHRCRSRRQAAAAVALSRCAATAIRCKNLLDGGIQWLRVKPWICFIRQCASRSTAASAWSLKLSSICLHFLLRQFRCWPQP